MSGEGFPEFMRQFNLPDDVNIATAHAWRHRYILQALTPPQE
jgi:hypothetical protein